MSLATARTELHSSKQQDDALEIQDHGHQVGLNTIANQAQVAAAAKAVPALGLSELALDLVSFRFTSLVLG